jgi:transposase InsO family protein
LATISVAHLYRLRNCVAYRNRNASYQPTRPSIIPIGERRKPQPNGMPGYLRIDTVHQGDQDGRKGLYHINAVDEVTQWQIVAATPQISELWLLPVLEAMLQQFPFVIRGFHSDNGSEFINYNVAALLSKLLVQQTKSRAYHCGDNGLVECKNGAIIRKHIGFGHIDARYAEAMDAFHQQQLNPYVNFHRPCAIPEVHTAANGKRRRTYTRWATPFEQLRESPHCPPCLRPDVSLAELESFAQRQTDTEAGLAMQAAKRKLFHTIRPGRTA